MTRWLTVADAAREAGVHPRTLRRWIGAGRLPAARRGGRWLIHRDELQIEQAHRGRASGREPATRRR
ncbi:MAG: helix-turn-helix domain-containing protein [Gemmatimonadales bacterium]